MTNRPMLAPRCPRSRRRAPDASQVSRDGLGPHHGPGAKTSAMKSPIPLSVSAFAQMTNVTASHLDSDLGLGPLTAQLCLTPTLPNAMESCSPLAKHAVGEHWTVTNSTGQSFDVVVTAGR